MKKTFGKMMAIAALALVGGFVMTAGGKASAATPEEAKQAVQQGSADTELSSCSCPARPQCQSCATRAICVACCNSGVGTCGGDHPEE